MITTAIIMLIVVCLGLSIYSRHRQQDRQATPRRRMRSQLSGKMRRLGHDPITESFSTKEQEELQASDDFDVEKVLEQNKVSEPTVDHEKLVDTDVAAIVDDAKSDEAEVAAASEMLNVQEPVTNINNNSQQFIVINVSAPPDHPYNGYELLQTLLVNGLRFGQYKIFHRHEDKNISKSVMFSVATLNQPGTFNLQEMGSFSCIGLTFFMSFDQHSHPKKCFDLMLQTARQFIDDLGGEMWDEQHARLTAETISSIRSRLIKFEESQCNLDLFPIAE